MHPEALAFVDRCRPRPRVLDLGGRDVNGTCRPLFGGWEYVSVDARPGPGVDVVADAAAWPGDGRPFDLAVCTEVLEHAADWPAVLAAAARLLRPGGWLLVTAAGPGRAPHACDGGPWTPACGEPYRPIAPAALRAALAAAGFAEGVVDALGEPAAPVDVRAAARKPGG